MGAGTDQYGYRGPRDISSELERWTGGQELTTLDDGTTRIRLELSTTTRGWDYSGTVEITAGSSRLTDQEREALIEQAAQLQTALRAAGSAERDLRNQRDGLGPYALPKAGK